MKLTKISVITAVLFCATILSSAASAQIFATAEITPDPLEFSDTKVGETSGSMDVTLTKTAGQLPVYIFSTRLGNNTDFAIYSDQCSQATLDDVGDSCTVKTTFSPQARGHFNTTFSAISLSQEIVDTSIVEGDGVAPAVTLSVPSIAFGDQTVDKSSSAHEVVMLNSGNESLAITDIAASDGFSVTDDCGDTLAADASCNIFVTFSPTAVQAYSGTITITDDASDSPQTIALTGTGMAQGTPDASLSTHAVDLGNQLIGTTGGATTVTLTSTGTVPLTVAAVTPSTDFATTTDCVGVIAVDANCTIDITFTPPTAGNFTGTVLIDDDASDSPQTINLTGVGVSNPGPQASLSATALDFGQVATSRRSEPQVVTITNSGDEDLVMENVAFGGDNPDVFDGTDNCESDTLQPGQSCSGAFTFYPRNKGIYSATVTITDNSGSSPQVITLAGIGIHASGGCNLITGATPLGALALIPALAGIAAWRRRRSSGAPHA